MEKPKIGYLYVGILTYYTEAFIRIESKVLRAYSYYKKLHFIKNAVPLFYGDCIFLYSTLISSKLSFAFLTARLKKVANSIRRTGAFGLYAVADEPFAIPKS